MASRLLAATVLVVLVGCDGQAGTESPRADPYAAPTGPEERSEAALWAMGRDDEPGCAAAVGRNGQVVWSGARGVADLDSGRPITTETVFDIGSVSKQFTATAVLLLAAEERLSVEDTVAAHLSGLPGWADRVSIEQLMHHTSGIPDYLGLLFDAGHDLADRTTQAQAVHALATVKLGFAPGSRFEYSNSNYLLLAEIVHQVSGQRLPDYLTDQVFAPLDLAMVMDPVAAIPGKATPYTWNESNPATPGAPVAGGSGWAQVGDGAIQTTPVELVRWADNYRTGRVGGQALLDAQLAGAVDEGQGSRYGAGIAVRRDGSLLHSGAWDGFLAHFQVSPDRSLAVAVTCNTDKPDPEAVAASLAKTWG
jgi:CubicO group peptidase (beta-lactamase class C family)